MSVQGNSPPRTGYIVAAVLAGLLLLGWFLPWMNSYRVHKDEESLGARTSGLQLTIGSFTPLDDGERLNPEREEEVREQIDETIRSRPWFALGLLGPLAILITALLCLSGRVPAAAGGKILAGVGGVGVLICLLASGVSYFGDFVARERERIEEALEKADSSTRREHLEMALTELNEKVDEQEEMYRESNKESGSVVLWISLLLNLAVGSFGVASLEMAGSAPVRGRGRSGHRRRPPRDEQTPSSGSAPE